MGKNLFTSEFYSSIGEKYKVDIFSESYSRLTWDIIGGSGNYFYIKGDWTPYMSLFDPFVLIDDDIPTSVTRSMSMFLYNEAEDRTEFRFTVGLYDAMWDRVKMDVNVDAFALNIANISTFWESEGDEVLQAIKSSNTMVDFMNDGSEVDYFMNLMLESDDDEFKLIIYKDVSSTWELEWVGNIVPDLFEWHDSPKPYQLTINAIDGLDRLKNIPYNEVETNHNETRIKTHLSNILEKNNLSQFWGVGDAYLRESIEYKSNEVSGLLTSAHSPLDYCYISDRMFLKKGDGRYTYEGVTCYDALKGILELFSCRMFISKGVYYIQQVRNYSGTNIYYREYSKALGIYSDSNYAPKLVVGDKNRSDDLVSMEGGTFGHLHGLRNATMNINMHEQVIISLPYVGNSFGTNPHFRTNTFEVFGGIGSGKRIRLDLNVLQLANVASTDICEVTVSINNGAWYWSGGLGRKEEWVLASSPNKDHKFKVQGIGWGKKKTLTLETDEIPFSGTLTMTVIVHWTDHRGIQIPVSGTSTDGFSVQPTISYPKGEEPIVEEIKSLNPNTKYTKELVLDTLIITDFSNLTSLNIVSVKEDYLTTNSTLVETVTWDAGFSSDKNLSETRVLEAVSVQAKPIRRYRGKIEGQYYPHNVFDYDNAVFYFNGFEKDYLMDENEGEWLQAIDVTSDVVYDSREGEIYDEDRNGEREGYPFRTLNENHHTISSIRTEVAAGTITSIDIYASGFNGVFEGDGIIIVNPTTNDVIEEFVLTSDILDTDTSMSVSSKVTTIDIEAGMVVQVKKESLIKGRWKHEVAKSAPTVIGDLQDGEIRIAEGKIYIRYGSVINVTDVTEEIS